MYEWSNRMMGPWQHILYPVTPSVEDMNPFSIARDDAAIGRHAAALSEGGSTVPTAAQSCENSVNFSFAYVVSWCFRSKSPVHSLFAPPPGPRLAIVYVGSSLKRHEYFVVLNS